MREGGKNYWFLNDHLGTPQQIVAENGGVVGKAQYAAFGKAEVDSGATVTNNLRFPGQYYDEETGLHYNWNRYYDAESGRYIQTDPIGFRGKDINMYRYANGNTNLNYDKNGLYFECEEHILRSEWRTDARTEISPFLDGVFNYRYIRLIGPKFGLSPNLDPRKNMPPIAPDMVLEIWVCEEKTFVVKKYAVLSRVVDAIYFCEEDRVNSCGENYKNYQTIKIFDKEVYRNEEKISEYILKENHNVYKIGEISILDILKLFKLVR